MCLLRFSLTLGLSASLLLFGQNVSAQPFESLSSAIEQGQFGNLKAVVISRYGEIVYEDYFHGAVAGDLHQVQSVTKSIGSALIGIAHRQGKIQLDQNLELFFGDLYPMTQSAYQNKRPITVQHILQQRHGIEWDEGRTDYRHPLNPVVQMIDSDDWYQYVLTRPMDAAPGQHFTYSTGASTLMSRMIRVATGVGPEAFARQELFGPLGIGTVHWEVYSEAGMGFGLTDWPGPDHDVPLGFSLWLTARDMLKFGELYLNGGVHNGHRILDESWVDASWTKFSHIGNSEFFSQPGWGHGYQWWIGEMVDARDRNWHIYFASGWGSQVIFVIPELGAVVVTAGDNYDYNGPDVDALLYSVLPEMNPRLDQHFNGAWYDPEMVGQGFSLEVLKDGAVVSFWYTYTPQGSQRWFLLQGNVDDGEAAMTIYETSGGVFLQGDPYNLEEWGSGQFRAIDCDHISLEIESREISTTIPLTRLSGVCFDPP
jgi:CubicO group peptidase (beta-lactamase class C family)